jgi:ABC-type multidrug transport system fused ATPase/permease subunit
MKVKDIISQALANKVSTIVFLVLAIILAVACEMFGILIVRNLVDDVFVKSIEENPGLALRVTAFCLTVLLWFGARVWIKDRSVMLGSYVSTELAGAVHSSVMRAELNELDKLDKEDILQKITVDCRKIGNDYITKTWIRFLQNLIFLVGVFITMIVINPALGLISYVALPVFFMITKTFDKFSEKLLITAEEEIKSSDARILENFTKVKSIKLKNGIRKEEDNFQKINERYIGLNRKIEILKQIKESMIFFLFVAGIIALIMGIGGFLSTRGESIPGTIVAFMAIIPFVYHSFRNLLATNISTKNISEELKSLDTLLNLRSEIRAEPISSLEAVTTLKFENVSYFSPKGNLEAINFELKSGEKLGILSLDGYSSTIIFNLLTKLIRPRDGSITINNCDISKLNTFYLRELITAIPQERSLFEDTIANNISYPLEFDEYKYNDALNRSGLKDILSEYEDKDQTVLNHDDPKAREMVELITLANAFYKDSKIFVLNEATSGLDVRSEEAVMKEIFRLKNKMIIIMSNKTYNIVNCDKVLILDNDQVLEYGRVDELLHDRNSALSKLIKKVKVGKNVKVS